jgi:tetratricopeptide (TPR) repeat protein
MASIDEARALVGAGRFGEALAVLSKARISPLDRIAADLLRAELLERVGQYDEARRQAHELFRSRRMDPAGRSGCCLVFARVESLAGRADSSITWLQRAISFAEEARSDERASWAKLRLMVRVAEHSGFEAAASVLSDARACAIRTGDPAILAAVHLYVAQTEAKRGLLASPRRHVRLAVEHLKAAPNVWLDAVASHIETALAIMSVNFADAVTCGKREVELAEQSGVADTIVTCVGTLAHVYFMTGDFASAASLIEWSAAKSGAGSDHQLTSLESLARIRLLEQRLDDCADLLTRADDLNDASRSSLRYVHRHILLTRAELLAYQRRWSDALTSLDVAISLDERTSDQLFTHTAALKKAELLSIVSRGNEALAVIAQSARTVSTQPIDVQAMYQRALGCTARTSRTPPHRITHGRAASFKPFTTVLA